MPRSTKGTKKNMNAQTSTEATEQLSPRDKLVQRLAATEALAEKYRQQINSLDQINNVQVGDDVTFRYGRAEKARDLPGVVTAVADTDQGRMVAIQTGEGLDVEIKKVRAADIVENRSAKERNGGEAEAPAEGGDPLAAA